jgi:hypothetical protein
VPTYEEFREKWIRLGVSQARPPRQYEYRHCGLADDDDAVAEQL